MRQLNKDILKELENIKTMLALVQDNIAKAEKDPVNENLGTANNLLPEIRKACSRLKRIMREDRITYDF